VTAGGSVEARVRLRLFLALRLPDDAVEALAVWQARELASARRARPVVAANLHVTLAFLGSRPAGDLEPVSQALRAAARPAVPPLLRVRRYRETRSVGMLVFEDEDGRAGALAEDLHGRLEALGVYQREQRPWLPHVTVLRFRDRPRLDPPLPDLGAVTPSEAAVYHSVLRPTGAQYEALEAVALGG
jgi:2'-5' RNA ligase